MEDGYGNLFLSLREEKGLKIYSKMGFWEHNGSKKDEVTGGREKST